MLNKAWEASRLLGYKSRKVDERNGLVMFPQEVLGLAEDGEVEVLEMRGGDAARLEQILEGMELNREYSVSEVAKLGGFSGSEAKVRSDVGGVMRQVLGVKLKMGVVERVSVKRRVYYVLRGV